VRLIVIAALALTSAGCANDGEADDASTLPSSVVAQVGEMTIGRAEFRRQFGFAGGDMSRPVSAQPEARRHAMSKLIAIAVLRQEAEKRGFTVSERDEQAMADEFRRSYGEKRYKKAKATLSDEDLRKYLVNGELLGMLAKRFEAERKGKVPAWMTSGQAEDLPRAWKARTVCHEDYAISACSG
jgi:hypothetical protein